MLKRITMIVASFSVMWFKTFYVAGQLVLCLISADDSGEDFAAPETSSSAVSHAGKVRTEPEHR